MRLIVLGSGAGGGVPQWNCACANCTAARAGILPSRTQASLAVSADEESWFLVGVSPDVRTQLALTPALWPRAFRHSPIVGAALPNGDLDAWLGLLSLREWTPLTVHATPPVRRDVMDNAALRTLDRRPGHTRWIDLTPGERYSVAPELSLEAVPVPGKVPVHMAGRRAPDALDNVGFVLRDQRSGSSAAWFPSVGGPTRELERALSQVDVLFFDGTFHRDGEPTAFGMPPARDMAHWPVAVSASWLARLPARKKWLVHINNTNPILARDSAERRELASHGIELGWDGLEITL